MSIFAPLQQKSARSTSSFIQRTAVSRQFRGVEQPKVASAAQPGASSDRDNTNGFSCANIPIDPPVRASDNKIEKHQENNTGLPDTLKANIESLSGLSLDDVHVHYNSPKPARMHAWAYTQGTDIHIGPRQEEHLPHEAWHVVQQKQRRVDSTKQMKGVAINDDEELEREAVTMGRKALQEKLASHLSGILKTIPISSVIQRINGDSDEEEEEEEQNYYENKNGAIISESDYDELLNLINRYDVALDRDIRRHNFHEAEEGQGIAEGLIRLVEFLDHENRNLTRVERSKKRTLNFQLDESVIHPGVGNNQHRQRYEGKSFIQILNMCKEGNECHNDLAEALRECLSTLKLTRTQKK